MWFTVSVEGSTRPYIQGELRRRRVEAVSRTNPAHPIRDKSKESEEDEASPFASPKQPSAQRRYRESSREGGQRGAAGQAVTAHDIMTTNVVSLAPETTVPDAWQIVAERRLRYVPVLSQQRELLGIVSDRDLLLSLGSPEEDRPISEVMSQPVLSAQPDTEIRDIARVMFEERLGTMPVLSADHDLVGIVTRSDILRTLVEHMPFELWI